MSYLRRVYRVPAALADDLAACLVAAGALGCATKDGETFDVGRPSEAAGGGPGRGGPASLEAWFAAGAAPFDIASWPGVELVASQRVEQRDWLAHYRASSRPFTVARFRIDPREVTEPGSRVLGPAQGGLIDLHVPAENAFGTGTHESTRLVLRWLDELADELPGRRVLDVGSGSGILSFAALRLGAALAVGFDLDPPSVATARRNGRRNGLEPCFFAGTAAALAVRPSAARPSAARQSFDLLLINVLPERIAGDLPRLLSLLAAGGRLISSGNLLDRRDELCARFEHHGLRLRGEKVDGDWVSFLFAA